MRRLSIKYRIILGFLFLTIIVGFFGGLMVRWHSSQLAKINLIVDSSIVELSSTGDVNYHIQRIKSNTRELLLTYLNSDDTSPQRVTEINHATEAILYSKSNLKREISSLIAATRKAIELDNEISDDDVSEKDELKAIMDLQSKVNVFVENVEVLVMQHSKNMDPKLALHYFEQEIEPLSREIQIISKEILIEAKDEIQRLAQIIRSDHYNLFLFSGFSTIIFVIVSIVLGSFLSISIARPIERLKKGVLNVTEGNLNVSLLQEAEDELGDLTSHFNSMAKKLHLSIKKLEEANRSAESANRAKSTFLATMSHEIRTPMNGILGMADLLADEDLSEKSRHHVALIQESGRSLLHIINDILDFSKIEAGRISLEQIDFDLHQLLNEVGRFFQPLANKKRIGFQLQIQSNVPMAIRGDPTRLRQILVNFISNAVKFTHEGKVKVSVERAVTSNSHHIIRFIIEDSGIGISSDNFKKLFHSFEQAEDSTTRQYGGTGLGLAITKKLTDLMGGEIKVDSELGKGSVFNVTIPFEPASDSFQGQQPAKHDASPKATIIPTTARLLVAEDESVNRLVIQGMLQRYGLNVEFAKNGSEALEKLTTSHYDLVFMDCQMPEMDGFDACRAFRNKEGKGHHTPIVALTAYAMAEDRKKCLDAGMDDYLSKPINGSSLSSALIRWLGKESRADTGKENSSLDNMRCIDREAFKLLKEDMGTGFNELIKLFLETIPLRMEEIIKLERSNDEPGFLKALHKFRGSVLQLGAIRLGKYAATLEQNGLQGSKESRRADIEALQRELAEVIEVITSQSSC
ncbi:MAG: response regulator [Magnetococcales bacterium]|nr:response regulator [Magnetococcales bacterium]